MESLSRGRGLALGEEMLCGGKESLFDGLKVYDTQMSPLRIVHGCLPMRPAVSIVGGLDQRLDISCQALRS
jgi:hypothetical protein